MSEYFDRISQVVISIAGHWQSDTIFDSADVQNNNTILQEDESILSQVLQAPWYGHIPR